MSYELDELKEKKAFAKWIAIGIIAIIVFVILLMAFLPVYRVWSQEMRGKAAFAEALQNKKNKIEAAKAKLERQKLNSMAEIERAKGMAKSIEYENGKLTAQYIQYLWVRNLEKSTGDKIYIPTEANLPILEAK